jgi:hypothetical protein
VARFCQFAESLGALILGYDGLKLSSNTQLDSTHATKVLTALSTFDVKDVDDLYKKFNFKQNGLIIKFCSDMIYWIIITETKSCILKKYREKP